MSTKIRNQYKQNERRFLLLLKRCAPELRGTAPSQSRPASSQSTDDAGPTQRWSTQRAGIALPHAAGDGLSGATGDEGLSGATDVPA